MRRRLAGSGLDSDAAADRHQGDADRPEASRLLFALISSAALAGRCCANATRRTTAWTIRLPNNRLNEHDPESGYRFPACAKP